MTSEIWVTSEQTLAATGWSERTLRRRSESGEVKWRNATDREAGRRRREYAASALPADAQKKIFEQEFLKAAAPKDSQLALIPAPSAEDKLFTTVQRPEVGERLLLSDADRKIAEERFDAIAPMIDFKKRSITAAKPTWKTLDGREIRNLESLALYLAEQRKISARTLWNWYGLYNARGLAGLADLKRSDKGKSRFFESHPEAQKFVQAKYLTEKLSITLCHEALVREWPNYRKDPDAPAPSYSTVRGYISRLPKPIVVVAREGARGYNSKIESYLLTDFDQLRVNQIWVSDHRVFDVFCANDCFPNATKKPLAPIRIWHTMVLDMRSRKCVGWAFADNPSSNSIASALRIAIEQYGCPESFYVDNGKDYKKVGKLAPGAEGLLHRLGIDVTYCLPGHPQSKLVESFFAGQSKRFDVIFGNAYAGRKPALRPEACDDLLKQQIEWLKTQQGPMPLQLASDFMLTADQWLHEYNERRHGGQAMRNLSPNSVFDAGYPAEERRIPDAGELGELYWNREKRKVLRGPSLQLYNAAYEPADAESSYLLTMAIGKDVTVACDPANVGHALVYDMDGNLMGKIQAQALVVRGPQSRDAISASLRERRAVLRILKNYVEWISRGVPTEADLLRQRAGVAAEPIMSNIKALPPISRSANALASAAAPAYSGDVVNDLLSEIENDLAHGD